MNKNSCTEKEIILNKMQVEIQKVITDEFLDSSVDIIDYLPNAILLNIRGYLWGESQTVATKRFPSDWKEWFKERWFPSWLKRKFPVKYQEWTVKADVIYPNLKISRPSDEHVIKLTSTCEYK
jgi:hypothetical protein